MENQKPIHPVLIVDDEKSTLKSMEFTFRSDGYNNIVCIQDSRLVIDYVATHPVEIIFLDITMPIISGEEILQTVHRNYPDIPVIMITGLNDVKTAVSCMKSGAKDYLLKPIERNRLLLTINNVLELKNMRRQYSLLKEHMLSSGLHNPQAFSHIITQNKQMIAIFKYMEAIGDSQEPVLIIGETGTGKELFAKAMYNLHRYRGKYVPINVAGLDDNMFTDTLFGHAKGAYTGAAAPRSGLIEKAENGLLFLDEIGELSLQSQIKILRLIQEKEYYPLGSDTLRRANCRIVVATNANLTEKIKEGTFRKDLFYRLFVHTVQIPPLCDRKDDIPVLTDFFLQEAAESFRKKKPTPPKELFSLLKTYSFPGNVRELRSLIYNAVSQHKSKVMSMEVISRTIHKNIKDFTTQERYDDSDENIFHSLDNIPTIGDMEKMLIREAMLRSENNQSIASRMLGISRQTLYKKLQDEE